MSVELDIPLNLDNDIVGVACRIIDFGPDHRAHVRGVYRAADLPVEVQAVIAASPDSTAWTLPGGSVVELVDGYPPCRSALTSPRPGPLVFGPAGRLFFLLFPTV